ncbi:hypothetical protein AA12717_0802 [Gluconacetobacter sacchari DSM 12717]|nr:hypothetical protein [Gluconacetobacter sacchari]GBQ21193.1 hypothetical protein AA12717_0802 [Gluconacetobacter sacchari DSM 12717]
MRDDDDISHEISASEMVDALVRTCGRRLARQKAHLHVLRCVEARRTDEAAFWLAVRALLDRRMEIDPEETDRFH